jgi:hypothetical protein
MIVVGCLLLLDITFHVVSVGRRCRAQGPEDQQEEAGVKMEEGNRSPRPDPEINFPPPPKPAIIIINIRQHRTLEQ